MRKKEAKVKDGEISALGLLSAAQMCAAEARVVNAGMASGLELMERAGCGVVEAIIETWPEMGAVPAYALVLCGPGNNGGDGLVVARLLKELGWTVDVFLLGAPERLPRDARVNFERWRSLGEVKPLNDAAIGRYFEENPETSVVIDALFGTGLSRPFHPVAALQSGIETRRSVSIDLPSGLCADSGRYLGFEGENPREGCIRADLTVTFHARKLGHVLGDGAIGSGHVVVKDIGLAPLACDPQIAREVVLDARRLEKVQGGHKFSSGSALVLSGGVGKSGAARLAARAALRIGAGVVTLGAPHCAQGEIAAQITALMLIRIEDAADLEVALDDARICALCIGPGLGINRAHALVRAALGTRHAPLRVVLDADALSAFADEPHALFDALGETCVLTPHFGEFTRLFPDIAADLNAPAEQGPAYSKVDAVRAAAKRAGCTILLKGVDTVIGDQTGRCAVHSASGARAAPWLATAGSGDVLAGIITGLLARGLTPFDAACTGAHLHVDCALAFGPGLIAEDLPEVLPKVLKQHLEAT
nr:NAD(P)H-hydrate dehydratase [Planktotalea arctica]